MSMAARGSMLVHANTLPPFAWVVSAYDRDWEHERLVERLLDAAAHLGLLGEVQSLVIGDGQLPQQLPGHSSAQAPEILAAALWQQAGPKQLIASGLLPSPWWLSVSWFLDAPQGTTACALDSIGRLTLRFSGDMRGDMAGSEALWHAFRRLHNGSNTTCSWIDAWDCLMDLRESSPPLISQATFEGVFWANFIDAECMARFCPGKLDLEGSAQVEWGSDGSLHLRLSNQLIDRNPDATRHADLEGLRRHIFQSFKESRIY